LTASIGASETTRLHRPRRHCSSSTPARVHRNPRPALMTFAQRPSEGRDRIAIVLICPPPSSEISENQKLSREGRLGAGGCCRLLTRSFGRCEADRLLRVALPLLSQLEKKLLVSERQRLNRKQFGFARQNPRLPFIAPPLVQVSPAFGRSGCNDPSVMAVRPSTSKNGYRHHKGHQCGCVHQRGKKQFP